MLSLEVVNSSPMFFLRQPDRTVLNPHFHAVAAGLVGKGEKFRRAVADTHAVRRFLFCHGTLPVYGFGARISSMVLLIVAVYRTNHAIDVGDRKPLENQGRYPE